MFLCLGNRLVIFAILTNERRNIISQFVRCYQTDLSDLLPCFNRFRKVVICHEIMLLRTKEIS